MNIVDRIILTKGEKALRPFRSNKIILKTPTFLSYNEYLPIIKTCYENVGYWHGTGHYQYTHSTTTRYESLDTNTITDLLGSIIQEGCLRPHDEPWLHKIQKKAVPTISLSSFRMYARLYAGLYLYEKDTIAYQFGTTKTWFRIFLRVQLFNKNFLKFLFTKGLFQLARISTFKNTKLWVRSIRKDGKNSNLLQGHLIRSDIPGNYPILVGVKKNIKLIHFNPGLGRLEARTPEPILLKDITHIEVTLSKVKETENFLKQKNINLLVIPFEFGEMYCSSYTFKELTGTPHYPQIKKGFEMF